MTLFVKTWNVRRRTTTEVLGEVQISETVSTFDGSIQPLNAKEQSLRQEGRLDSGRVKVYTGDTLNVGAEGGGLVGDLVEYDGRWYEIVGGHAYLNGLIPHRKYEAVLRADA